MGNVVGEILPLAIGVALSPISVTAVILLLYTQRPKANSLAFVGGWSLVLVTIGGVTFAVAYVRGYPSDTDLALAQSIISLIIGVILITLAVRSFRRRPKKGEEMELLRRLQKRVEGITPDRALLLGLALVVATPKNLGMSVLASLTIVEADLLGAETIGAIVLFIVIACSSVVSPVALYIARGDRAYNTLDNWKFWLIAKDAIATFLVYLAMGTWQLISGISGLTG